MTTAFAANCIALSSANVATPEPCQELPAIEDEAIASALNPSAAAQTNGPFAVVVDVAVVIAVHHKLEHASTFSNAELCVPLVGIDKFITRTTRLPESTALSCANVVVPEPLSPNFRP